MSTPTKITDIVFDFDGTCTQIPIIHKQYLEQYRLNLNAVLMSFVNPSAIGFVVTDNIWQNAIKDVRDNSPVAGWMIATCPSAPAAADPYILADEATKLILRNAGIAYTGIIGLGTIHPNALAVNLAPWRPDALSTFTELINRDIKVHIVSNSSSKGINKRLLEIFKADDTLLPKIVVDSDAAKFNICELSWKPKSNPEIPADTARMFTDLPAAQRCDGLSRPIYLRRGSYFETICKAFSNDLTRLSTTVFCGDIWEMDLAMPYELGANIHLVERADPFHTYSFEKDAVRACGDRGKITTELSGVLDWL